MTLSKTQSSFYRRLYLAHLIECGISSVPAIVNATGMPRRTAQDTLKALEELEIRCEFRPTPGERHNSGSYAIVDWGPIDPAWVREHAERLRTALSYPAMSRA